MSIQNELLLTTRFLSFSMLLQAFEMFQIASKRSFSQVWSFENLQNDFTKAIPLPISILNKIFSVRALQFISITQMGLAIYATLFPHWILFALLFITHLYTCVRFRGTFNGGSDMMTFVVLTGVLIIWGWDQVIGSIYIMIHLIYSYFKAGAAKAVRKEWWNGHAMPIFLKRSVISNSHSLAHWLEKHPAVSRLLGWTTVIFELLSIPMLFKQQYLFAYFAIAMMFHFFVYLMFGLNRFMWIWFAAWQAAWFAIPYLKSWLKF